MTGRASRVLGLLTLVVCPGGLHAQPRPPDSVRAAAARVRAAVDAIAEPARQRRQLAGMVVLAIRAGDTLLHRAYGLAEVENGVPLTTGHVFQLASITKQFTAAAVLRLAGEGRVDLEASITRYLPDAPTQGHPITVRQLLTHTSGIPDYAESPRIRTLKRLDLPPDSLVGLVRGTPFYFAPGDQMRYSNTGFVLLGQLIERVTGMPYHTYVEEHLLRPMGATVTRFCDPGALIPRLARGYSAAGGGLKPADFISPHVPYAAGGFCGTAGDLAVWNAGLHAVRGGRVLPAELYQAMQQPARIRGGRTTRYGLGLALTRIGGRRALSHGGDIDGFTTFTAWLPEDSLNVVVLINTQGPIRPDAVTLAVVEAASGRRALTTPTGPPGSPAAFEGKYASDVVVIAVDPEGRSLRLERGPLPAADLRFDGRDDHGWRYTDGRAIYTFEPPGPGESRSPAVWADLGVSFVRWTRAP